MAAMVFVVGSIETEALDSALELTIEIKKFTC
jgi:hypothetical protein